MEARNTLVIQASQLATIISGVEWKEMCYLGKVVDNDPYGIVPLALSWQTRDEIHADFVPLPFRHLERL